MKNYDVKVFKYEILFSIFQGLRLILVLRKNNFMSLCKPTISNIRFGRIIVSALCSLLILIVKVKKEGSRIVIVPQLLTELLLYWHQLFKNRLSPLPACISFAISLIAQAFFKNYEYPDRIENGNFNVGFQRYHIMRPKFNISLFYPTLDKLTNSNRTLWLIEKSYLYHPYLSMKEVFKEMTGFHLPRFPFKVALHFLSKKTLPAIKNAELLEPKNLYYKKRGRNFAINTELQDNLEGDCNAFQRKSPENGGKFKVLVYCHGFSAHASSSFFLFQDLCSRGWIIISIDFEESLKVRARISDEILLRGQQLVKRVETLRTVISMLYNEERYELNPDMRKILKKNPILKDITNGKVKLDLDNLVVLGHSMGGATALMGAMLDPRIKLCVALDPAFITLPEEMRACPLKCPFLILNCWKFYRVLLKSMMNDNLISEFMNLDHTFKGFNISCYLMGSHHISQTDFDMFMPGETKLLGMNYYLDDLRFFKEANLVLINLFLENFIDNPRDQWKDSSEILRFYEETIYKKTGKLNTLYFYEDIGLAKVRIV